MRNLETPLRQGILVAVASRVGTKDFRLFGRSFSLLALCLSFSCVSFRLGRRYNGARQSLALLQNRAAGGRAMPASTMLVEVLMSMNTSVLRITVLARECRRWAWLGITIRIP